MGGVGAAAFGVKSDFWVGREDLRTFCLRFIGLFRFFAERMGTMTRSLCERAQGVRLSNLGF
jgi:hypothetical protein